MNAQPHNNKEQKEEVGAFIGSVIVILILIAGAVYFIKSEADKQKQAALEVQQIKASNQSDAAILQSIENQLNVPEPDYINGLQ